MQPPHLDTHNRSVAKESAGLLLYRRRDRTLEVLLVHPGGPFWKRREEGAWSLPKGEIEQGERPIEVARREFQEELGQPPPDGSFTPLGSIRQAGGKVVHAWRHLQRGVAASLRSDAGVPRGRQGGMVRSPDGSPHDPAGPEHVSRSARSGAVDTRSPAGFELVTRAAGGARSI